MVKTIIFDVNRVLVSIDIEALYVNFAKRVGVEPQSVIDFHKKNLPVLLLGDMTFEESLKAMRVRSDLSVDEALGIWVEEASRKRTINQELLGIVDSLRKNYTLVILTNLSESRMPVDEKDGLYEHFDQVVLSYKEHLKKPDEAFFRIALQRTATQPGEAIFIDDKEANVFAAEKLGMKGIVFQNNEQLKNALLNLRIKF